jgi:hypothetical protein
MKWFTSNSILRDGLATRAQGSALFEIHLRLSIKTGETSFTVRAHVYQWAWSPSGNLSVQSSSHFQGIYCPGRQYLTPRSLVKVASWFPSTHPVGFTGHRKDEVARRHLRICRPIPTVSPSPPTINFFSIEQSSTTIKQRASDRAPLVWPYFFARNTAMRNLGEVVASSWRWGRFLVWLG